MPTLDTLSVAELRDRRDQARARYDAFRQRGLDLNMSRGKPSEAQLDLANRLLELPGTDDYRAADGTDCRNYGGSLQGLPEARALFSGLLGAPVEQILIAANASLTLMHDLLAFALLTSVPDGRGPWSAEAPITFLCPVPGYDRHFALCEQYGIRMVSVPLTGHGPDMDRIEALVADDPSIKGMWCVPKYSNPTGEIYSDETVERLARMKTAAPDFRLFWDNAYAVHHLTGTPYDVANILEACERHGTPNRPFVIASTSKITLAGAGLGLFAASPENMRGLVERMSRQTIGPDKVNQLRHVRFLRDQAGLMAHMEKHREILAPKFRAVLDTFAERLGGTGVATWTEPKGGYFISLDVLDGCATRIVELAKGAGIALTGAGATFPYGRDPHDRNIRIAPTYPSVEEVKQAAEGVALCTLLATTEALLAGRDTQPIAAAAPAV
ncbi:MAG: aminotransferase class I/II-fold pyridoxal phosphate-dependent enzyme [Chloroflexota bacterium]|nr:aminotransferase class I/II-fold pyridoxal phosphate-dependent enzyme [Chloroflexota bacterium]